MKWWRWLLLLVIVAVTGMVPEAVPAWAGAARTRAAETRQAFKRWAESFMTGSLV